MLVDILDQAVRVLAHFKEIRFLSGGLHLSAAVRTFPVHKLGFREEGLAGRTVHTLIVPFVDIALVVQAFKNLLNLGLVILVRGTDKFVIGGVHQIPDPPDLPCHIIHKLLRRNPGFLCLELDFLSMLVRSRLEKYVVALGSLKPGDAVRQNHLVGVADVRLAGCVGNGCRNVIFFSCPSYNPLFLWRNDRGFSLCAPVRELLAASRKRASRGAFCLIGDEVS